MASAARLAYPVTRLPEPVALPLAPAPLREFCACCWGTGRIWEMSGGVVQIPPVPCEECFGSGRSWRAGA